MVVCWIRFNFPIHPQLGGDPSHLEGMRITVERSCRASAASNPDPLSHVILWFRLQGISKQTNKQARKQATILILSCFQYLQSRPTLPSRQQDWCLKYFDFRLIARHANKTEIPIFNSFWLIVKTLVILVQPGCRHLLGILADGAASPFYLLPLAEFCWIWKVWFRGCATTLVFRAIEL